MIILNAERNEKFPVEVFSHLHSGESADDYGKDIGIHVIVLEHLSRLEAEFLT